jgi:hypothetical protein
MATTTNYSWDTPDDTDLVKDGAAAIRTLGSSIDTTTKALNPSTTLGDIEYRSSTANTNTRLAIGTTGQVLAVVGGVPAWATTADQTPLTTKGDLFTFDTADARLPVGTNDQILVADSSTATGLKWATPASGASFAGVAVTKTANQLINDTTYTVLSFNSEDLDIGGYHDNASNNSRLTVPSGKAGYYYAYFSIAFAGNSSNGGSGRRAFIMKNGAVASLCNDQSDVSTTVNKSLTSSNIFNLTVGDYLEVAAFQTSSSAVNLIGGDYYCVFGMTYLGA